MTTFVVQKWSDIGTNSVGEKWLNIDNFVFDYYLADFSLPHFSGL